MRPEIEEEVQAWLENLNQLFVRKASADRFAQEAEDIAHDTIALIWKNIDKVLATEDLARYVLGIYRNVLHEHAAQRNRTQEAHSELMKASERTSSTNGEELVEEPRTGSAEDSMTIQQAYQHLLRLAEQFRPATAAIVQMLTEGRSYKEIGLALGISKEQARKQFSDFRGMVRGQWGSKLRKLLDLGGKL